MIAKLLTLSRMLRDSVPFGIALDDSECARSDASLLLVRHADALAAIGCALDSARWALADARQLGADHQAQMAEISALQGALAAARSAASDALGEAAITLVSA